MLIQRIAGCVGVFGTRVQRPDDGAQPRIEASCAAYVGTRYGGMSLYWIARMPTPPYNRRLPRSVAARYPVRKVTGDASEARNTQP